MDIKTIDRINKKLVFVAVICLGVIGILFLVSFIGGMMMTPLLYLMCGITGGFVSIQQRMNKMAKDELELLANTTFKLFLIPIYGGIFSLLLFTLFLSGMIKGELAPLFNPPAFSNDVNSMKIFLKQTNAASPQDFCKMIIWAFAAGFSERLVPNFLGKLNLNGNTPEIKPEDNSGEKPDPGV